MRVGLVRNVALGMVALVGLGLAGCDDNPTDFETDETVSIFANPTVMTVPAGVTTLLSSRTENAGNEPTWEEITASVDGSCGSGAITVDVADSYEPTLQPPGQFDVTGGNTWGESCIQLSGGGQSVTIEVMVVADSLAITGAPDTLNLNQTAQLTAALLSSDATGVTPFDQTTDLVWSSDDPDVISVDQSGLITSNGPGTATITAVWTEFGVSVSASTPPIATGELPTLEIVGAPDTLDINTSVDLSATLTNPPSFDFGPFDPDTDVEWSSSDEDELTVDAVTGVVTAVGPAGATITATWTENDNVTTSVAIAVFVTPPALTSTDVGAAAALDTVTITGTGMLPGLHSIFIDGEPVPAFYEPEVTDATTASFLMPGGAAATVEITVGVDGIPSNGLNVDRTCGATDASCATEPANDAAAGAPDVGALPVSFAGFVDGDDTTDLLEFTLAAETTFDILLDWTGDSGDMDVVFTTTGATNYSEAECGFVTATGSQPESGECTLAAGTYYLWVESYDAELGFYQLDLVEVP